MARLTKLPSQAIIDGLKGKVDFYLWKGIPVARSWPQYHPRTPTPAEKANQDSFKLVNQSWKDQSEFIKTQYDWMASGTAFTAKDLFVRSYMSGLKLPLANQ